MASGNIRKVGSLWACSKFLKLTTSETVLGDYICNKIYKHRCMIVENFREAQPVKGESPGSPPFK